MFALNTCQNLQVSDIYLFKLMIGTACKTGKYCLYHSLKTVYNTGMHTIFPMFNLHARASQLPAIIKLISHEHVGLRIEEARFL